MATVARVLARLFPSFFPKLQWVQKGRRPGEAGGPGGEVGRRAV